jgi:hypothetical protein
MHDSSKCPICHGTATQGSMSDETFFAFLARCRRELEEKQSRFLNRIADAATWSYDMADGSLTIGNRRFAMTPIGTHNAEHQSWLWAWANDAFPSAAREASRRLQGLHHVTGFRVFLDPGIPAASIDAQDFSAMAVHFLDAIGFYRVPSNDVTLYLAVHEYPGAT